MQTPPKLLLDENISHRLLAKLADIYPDSVHSHLVIGSEAKDMTIWNYAKSHDFMILSKDEDFYNMSKLYGHPPKLIWLKSGNTSISYIETLLRRYYDAIITTYNDTEKSLIILPDGYV